MAEQQHTYTRSPLRRAVQAVLPADRRYRLRQRLMELRFASDALVRLDPSMRVMRITPETRLVLDGYGRSANSYSRSAFLYSNPGISLATHGHTPALIQRGVRRALPTVVLIRKPRGAIASGVQFAPGVQLSSATEVWCRYYEKVLPLLDDVVVATFDEATDDFGAVTKRINERFGTSFTPYVRSDEGEAWIADHIGEATEMIAEPERREEVIPLPSGQRVKASDLLAGISASEEAGFRRAEALYDRVVAERRS